MLSIGSDKNHNTNEKGVKMSNFKNRDVKKKNGFGFQDFAIEVTKCYNWYIIKLYVYSHYLGNIYL